MIRVTILGAGHVGQAVAALAGTRPGVAVTLWSRRFRRRGRAVLRAFGSRGTYAVADVALEASARRSVKDADVVIVTVPIHARHEVLKQVRPALRSCLLVSWEGMGPFDESLQTLGLTHLHACGLQRSPLVCRTRRPLHDVEILGVRSRVVMAAVRRADTSRAKAMLEPLLHIRLIAAPTYTCVSLSPSNPLIHSARLYTWSRMQHSGRRFYADWDDDASEVLLRLHGELKTLRDALKLPATLVHTLADRRVNAARVTREIRSAECLEEVMVPLRHTSAGKGLDFDHRFFREDIDAGLRHIVSIADRVEVPMPTATDICGWYDRVTTGLPVH